MKVYKIQQYIGNDEWVISSKKDFLTIEDAEKRVKNFFMKEYPQYKYRIISIEEIKRY